MGTTSRTQFYLPTITPAEAAGVWPTPFNAGLTAHEDHFAHRNYDIDQHIVHVDAVNGSNGFDSDVIGWDDYPYQTLIQAVADDPVSGNDHIGYTIHLKGSPALHPDGTVPAAVYATGGATMPLLSYVLLWGAGGDADRQRASSLIKDTVSDVMVALSGRYVTMQNIGVWNASTNAASAAVGSLTGGIGGGMQGARLDRVHAYSSYRGALFTGFNVDSTLLLQAQFTKNRHEGLVLSADSGGNSPNAIMGIQTEINQNNTDLVAGVANILLEVNDSAADSGNLFTLLGFKIHGSYTRADVKGYHMTTFMFGYLEANQGYADNESSFKIDIGLGGSTSKYWAQNWGLFRTRFHNAERATSANWTRGRGLLVHGDKVIGVRWRENAVENTDADTSNPVVRLGANVWDALIEFGAGVSIKTVPTDHSSLLTDPQKLILTLGRTVSDAAITSGATTLTSATAAFTVNDIGKVVFVAGASTGGKTLRTTISAYTNSTTVTVSNAATATTSGALLEIEGGGGRVRGSYYDHNVHLTKKFGELLTKWFTVGDGLNVDGGGAAVATEGTSPNAFKVIDLRNANTDGVLFSYYLPKDYTERASVYFTVKWVADTSGGPVSANWIATVIEEADDQNVQTGSPTTTTFTGISRTFTNHKFVYETRIKVFTTTQDATRVLRMTLQRDGTGDSYTGVARLVGVLVEVISPSF